MECTACRTSNRDGAKFCKQCGAALTRTCAGCGAVSPASRKFCSGCGAKLAPVLTDGNAAEKPQASAVAPTPPPPPPPPPASQPAPSPALGEPAQPSRAPAIAPPAAEITGDAMVRAGHATAMAGPAVGASIPTSGEAREQTPASPAAASDPGSPAPASPGEPVASDRTAHRAPLERRSAAPVGARVPPWSRYAMALVAVAVVAAATFGWQRRNVAPSAATSERVEAPVHVTPAPTATVASSPPAAAAVTEAPPAKSTVITETREEAGLPPVEPPPVTMNARPAPPAEPVQAPPPALAPRTAARSAEPHRRTVPPLDDDDTATAPATSGPTARARNPAPAHEPRARTPQHDEIRQRKEQLRRELGL